MTTSRRDFLIGAAAVLGHASNAGRRARAAEPPVPTGRPNFILITTDDHGYGDLSCCGNRQVATPHLDALAESGVQLTSWYANSPVCSPSRASLLTGRYPANAGVRLILPGHREAKGMPPGIPTIAGALRNLGYRTGMAGKWHLGVAEEFRPHHHGFDDWFGFLSGCVDYYSHIYYWERGYLPVHDLWDNNVEVWHDGLYLTELITERAVKFIDDAARRDQPFFLYLPYSAPHYPMHAPQRYLDRFDEDMPWDQRIYAAMLAAADDGVGAVTNALERLGLRDNTFIFFQSDNGPSGENRNWLDGSRDVYRKNAAGSLKGRKGSLFDGGMRVPALASWPARIPAGQKVDQFGAAMDTFPTFLAAAGGDPAALDLDGTDILPMLANGAPSPHEQVYWEYGQQTAIRRGPWKLTLNGQLVKGMPPDDPVFLANIEDDPAERRNLAKAEPKLAAELQGEATAWRNEVDRRWIATNGAAAMSRNSLATEPPL